MSSIEEIVTRLERKRRKHATSKDFDDRVTELRGVISQARTANSRQAALDAACDLLDAAINDAAGTEDFVVKFENKEIKYYAHAGVWARTPEAREADAALDAKIDALFGAKAH